MAVFMVLFSILLFFTAEEKLGHFYTVGAFILGACTSMLAGFIGMRIAVATNVKVTKEAAYGMDRAFIVAYRGGAVLGFTLTGLGLFTLVCLIMFYKLIYLPETTSKDDWLHMFENIAGYGLGGSSIALFGRVGGGIYTKAADVGSDLVGKVVAGLEEDSPQNPGVIADNVGDNVGDIAGMGSDLFGSFAESTCACLVVSATSEQLVNGEEAYYYFPLLISGAGIIVAIITTLFTLVMKVNERPKIESTLKWQLIISTALMTPALWLCAELALPAEFNFADMKGKTVTRMGAFFCAACGLWGGLIIGYFTEYFTSNQYRPVQTVANACTTGAATNIIYGLALGYSSTVIPVLALAVSIYVSFELAGMYGIALAALGMLSTICIALTIDGYGPIADNAGGIAEMCEMEECREITDCLDAAGNTTAAVGKGFAIGSACLVGLALFGAFVTRTGLKEVNILQPLQFSGLIVGAMLPYAFSALTMKSVGMAATQMINEIKRQFETGKILEGLEEPDYERCIAISTNASLKEMIAPGLLVSESPSNVRVGAAESLLRRALLRP